VTISRDDLEPQVAVRRRPAVQEQLLEVAGLYVEAVADPPAVAVDADAPSAVLMLVDAVDFERHRSLRRLRRMVTGAVRKTIVAATAT
jgi:hypothetical protein